MASLKIKPIKMTMLNSLATNANISITPCYGN